MAAGTRSAGSPGRALKGNLHLAESEQQVLIAYRQAIQRAFGDVSDALIGYGKLDQVRTRQQDTVADLQERVAFPHFAKGGTTCTDAGRGAGRRIQKPRPSL
jgi:hypothetical protein